MSWSSVAVKTARRNYDIAGRANTIEDPELLSFNGAARYLAVSNTTIARLAKARVLPIQQAAPFAPWEIRRRDLDSEAVRRAVAQLKETGRLQLEGESSNLQRKLFE